MGGNASGSSSTTDGGSSSGCGSVPATGICDGLLMKWCPNGQLEVEDCSLENTTCNQDSSGAWCNHEQPTAGNCGTITSSGACVGSVLEVCNSGTLQTTDCSEEGATCVVGSTGASCSDMTPPSASGCGDVTSSGICDTDGVTMYFCNGGILDEVDCSNHGGCVVDPTWGAGCAS